MGVLGAVGGMEAVRALPPAAQIQAVKGIAEAGNAVDRAGNAVRNWARNNPNTSEVAKAAANVGGTAFGMTRGLRPSSSSIVQKETSSLKRIANNQKSTINLNNKSPGEIVRAQSDKRISLILNDAVKGRETKGRTSQYEKSGGFNKAVVDFNSLGLKNIQNRGENKFTGTLPDGRKVNVRVDSSDGRPTLEIQQKNKKTKIRYGD